jgi:hypothetical protein
MKVFITGGTGFVGTNLTRKLLERGHEVTVAGFSGKSRLDDHPALHIMKADTTEEGVWQRGLARFDVIINLAGRSIFSYWSETYKEKMYSSRILTTRNIVQALPKNTDIVLLSTSAVGYYGDRGEEEVDEQAEAGSDFLANVAKNWEREAYNARDKGARVATTRFGIVLGKGGGALATMKTPFKLGLGGAIGDGRQWFPWIHIDDLTAALIFLMDAGDLDGPFNFTAPGLVRQKEFAKTLAGVLKRPAVIPVPGFLIKTLGGEFGRMLLQGQKVLPKALMEHGFVFKYPELKGALQSILK